MIEIIPNWHPIFVHFTVALLSVAIGLHALSLLIPSIKLKEQWRIAARWNLWIGMIITVITVLTGWYAYNTVAHDEPSHLAMTDHRNWALATASLFLIATAWSILRHRAGKGASPLLLSLLVVAMAALGTTAWRGGEVVYRYGLGVVSLPNTGMHEHAHDEGEHAHASDDVVEHHEEHEESSSPASTTHEQEHLNSAQVEPHDHHEHSEPHTH
jgi:uncharacterized membrane protein